jgi:hypothetical protein
LPKQREAQEDEGIREAQACQVFQVLHMGHLTSMCPTKQVVEQQVEPQSKPQVEQEKKPQEQIKINHDDGSNLMKKKKTRRGERAKHPMLIQDAKMVSKNQ